MKQDKHISANPYSIKHPQWKHWSLGVLVFRGALTAEQVVSWEADSPASTAFWQGHEAARRAEALFLEDGDDGHFLWLSQDEIKNGFDAAEN